MAILDFLRRWIGKMFPKQSLEKSLNVQIATSGIMDEAIQLWLNMYKNTPPWKGGEDCVKCLNLPATIAEELARLVLTEFDIKIDGSERAMFISDQMSTMLENMSNIVEMWCALGGIVLKPYAAGENEVTGDPDHIEVDVIYANRFYPTAFNSNKEVTGAVFVETKHIGDYIYTRLEYHSLVGTHYTVINKAYQSERLNTSLTDDGQISARQPFQQEISLEQVDDWKGLSPKVEIDNLEKPLFVYIKMPRANNIDPLSPLGTSVFARARGVIEEADKQFGRTIWEYEAKEAAIDADETLFKKKPYGDYVLPKGKERLYRKYDFENTEKSGFIEAFSPDIRDESMFNGLNKLFRQIEFLCGLAYGTISEVSEVEKTAEEIRASKHRSYSSVHAMQKVWDKGFDNLIYVMDAVCTLYDMASDGSIEKTVTWGDGILEDTDVEYQRRWSMVMAGKLKLEKFYAWYFGCSEEEAKEMIPQETTYPPPE